MNRIKASITRPPKWGNKIKLHEWLHMATRAAAGPPVAKRGSGAKKKGQQFKKTSQHQQSSLIQWAACPYPLEHIVAESKGKCSNRALSTEH